MKKLILFDIDGTLVHTGGAGTLSMNKAFFERFGIQDAFKNILMAGKTDRQIMREGLISHSLPYMDGNVELLVKGYLQISGLRLITRGENFNPESSRCSMY
ncbi:MAG: hypothetical protein L0958_06025 [Candidatus Mariimomonas ferrooxydans]